MVAWSARAFCSRVSSLTILTSCVVSAASTGTVTVVGVFVEEGTASCSTWVPVSGVSVRSVMGMPALVWVVAGSVMSCSVIRSPFCPCVGMSVGMACSTILPALFPPPSTLAVVRTGEVLVGELRVTVETF